MSGEAEDFYHCCDIKHQLSIAYFPQSSGGAEISVELTKMLLEDNVDSHGTLDTNKFVHVLLMLKKSTPGRDCKQSHCYFCKHFSRHNTMFGQISTNSINYKRLK